MNPVIQILSSLEVRWEGTDSGLAPELVGDTSNSIRAQGEAALPQLIQALSDKDLFVAAHVLLTQLSGVEYQTFPAWNGLEVTIAADGAVTIDPDQRFDLARRWERWSTSAPRPTMLPPRH